MAYKSDTLNDSSVLAQQNLWVATEKLAKTQIIRSWLDFAVTAQEWVNELHLKICRIPAPTFQEQSRAEYIAGIFRELGHTASIDDAGNVIVPIVFQPGYPFVAICAHMDTVLAPRQPSDIVLDESGIFHGPGVTDNGAGLASLVALGKLFKNYDQFSASREITIKKNILLVANVAEEGEGNLLGMNYLCQRSPLAKKISSFLILDGASTNHITAEALGSRRFEIVIEGLGGHSWNDFGTANPVHALARTVAILADSDLPTSPRTILNVGVITGGLAVNSIAATARAKVDIRSEDNEVMDTLVHTLEDALKMGVEIENRRTTHHLSNYKIREIGRRPAATLSSQNYVVDVIRAADSQLGMESRLERASTDANTPLALGLPAAAIGAGGRGGNVHTPSEWFHPEGRQIGLQRVILSLSLLLTKEFNSKSEEVANMESDF